MKRRKFICLSAATAAAISLPMAGCNTAANEPEMLSALTNEKTLREIGLAYLQQNPAENNEGTLRKLTGNANPQQDFINGNIIVIRGWVISLTEARQCALLTL